MILGLLGKGGSGKSSIATQVALWLRQKNNTVLAIDADHNMDLAYNLFEGKIPEDMPYLGDNLENIKQHLGLNKEEQYDQVFFKETPTTFSLNPCDETTKTLSRNTSHGLRVMAAGPQTDNVLYGKSCSHILTTPLKIYLPLLELHDNEYVVVDEKAGADGVTTGVITGIDIGIIVCEPALHSIKTAQQIAELMDFYETPYIFVGNKIQRDEDKNFIEKHLQKIPTTYLRERTDIKHDPSLTVEEWYGEIQTIINHSHTLSQNNRKERTIKKFQRNRDFVQNT